MNLRVAWSNSLLVSIVSRSSPYKMNLSKTSFERDEKPRGSNIAFTLLRRPDLGPLYEWQRSRKCSVSSMKTRWQCSCLTVDVTALCYILIYIPFKLSSFPKYFELILIISSWIKYSNISKIFRVESSNCLFFFRANVFFTLKHQLKECVAGTLHFLTSMNHFTFQTSLDVLRPLRILQNFR